MDGTALPYAREWLWGVYLMLLFEGSKCFQDHGFVVLNHYFTFSLMKSSTGQGKNV